MPDDQTHHVTRNLEATREALDCVLEEGITPHRAMIARAHDDGEVALVFHDIGPTVAPTARAMGWRGGKSECIRMSRTFAERFAGVLPSGDPCATWLRGRRPGRIRVFSGEGTLCVEFESGAGFRLVPGTTDREWKS